MKSRVIVAAVIEKDEHFLFGKKHPGVGPYPDKWLILGGGVNLGEESIEDALKREVREEASIEIDELERIDFSDDIAEKNGEMVHHIFLTFKAKYKSGTLNPTDDIAELKWVHKSKIPELEHSKPSIQLFKKLGYLN